MLGDQLGRNKLVEDGWVDRWKWRVIKILTSTPDGESLRALAHTVFRHGVMTPLLLPFYHRLPSRSVTRDLDGKWVHSHISSYSGTFKTSPESQCSRECGSFHTRP